MQASSLIFVLLILSGFAYYLGVKRSFAVAGGEIRKLHSLPSFYGLYTALWCGIPAMVILAIWTIFETPIVTNLVVSSLPENYQQLSSDRLNLVVNDIKNLVHGNIISGEPSAEIRLAADYYQHLMKIGDYTATVLVLVVAVILALISLRSIHVNQRARNAVEKAVTVCPTDIEYR